MSDQVESRGGQVQLYSGFAYTPFARRTRVYLYKKYWMQRRMPCTSQKAPKGVADCVLELMIPPTKRPGSVVVTRPY